MFFDEILSSTVDEDYHHLSDQDIWSVSHPESVGLVLASKSLGVLADLTTEFKEASRHTLQKTELAEKEDELGTGTKVTPQSEVILEESRTVVDARVDLIEVREVKKTPSEILAEAEQSFLTFNVMKTSL